MELCFMTKDTGNIDIEKEKTRKEPSSYFQMSTASLPWEMN